MRRIIKHTDPRRDRRRGAAVVEFAILAPVFLTLIIGSIEAGKALETGNIMSAALREGGRLASMDWTSVVPDGMTANQKVESDIRNFLTAAELPGSTMIVSITSAEGSDEGQYFDLANPDNRLRLFRISAKLPYVEGGPFVTSLTDDGGFAASMVFRAARTQLSN